MEKIVLILVLIVQLCAAYSPPVCDKNEVFMDCGPRCPQNCKVRARECKSAGSCEPGCYCVEGFVRYNGKCREAKQVCCPRNEIFSCGSACQNECDKLGQDCPIKTLVCVENCFCIDGYARDGNGRCIPESSCPPNSTTGCRAYEHYDACAPKFEPTCANRSPRGCGGSKCNPKCVCDEGYIRDENNRCILLSECTTCPRHQHYDACGNRCQGTCSQPNRPLFCKMACGPGCFCDEGYLYNEQTSECVLKC